MKLLYYIPVTVVPVIVVPVTVAVVYEAPSIYVTSLLKEHLAILEHKGCVEMSPITIINKHHLLGVKIGPQLLSYNLA